MGLLQKSYGGPSPHSRLFSFHSLHAFLPKLPLLPILSHQSLSTSFFVIVNVKIPSLLALYTTQERSPELYGTAVDPANSSQSSMPALYQVDRRFSQGDTTNESASNYNAAESNAMSESWSPANLQYTPATVVDDFNDSGFFKTNIANTVQANYKDWSLFEDELIDVDVDTSRFFAEIDSSIIAHNGSVSERTESKNSAIVESLAAGDRQPPNRTKQLPYDPVHEAIQEATQQAVGEAVREAMKQINLDTAGETNNYGNEDLESSTHTPIETWANTCHRHEYIAYLLEQDSYRLRDFRQFEEEEQYTDRCPCGSQ